MKHRIRIKRRDGIRQRYWIGKKIRARSRWKDFTSKRYINKSTEELKQLYRDFDKIGAIEWKEQIHDELTKRLPQDKYDEFFGITKEERQRADIMDKQFDGIPLTPEELGIVKKDEEEMEKKFAILKEKKINKNFGSFASKRKIVDLEEILPIAKEFKKDLINRCEPLDICEHANQQLADMIKKKYPTVKNINIAHGTFKGKPHVWLEDDSGFILDITSDQFGKDPLKFPADPEDYESEDVEQI